MSVSEVELLLTKHVSHRDKSFEVWLPGRPRGGGGGGFWRLRRHKLLYTYLIGMKLLKICFDFESKSISIHKIFTSITSFPGALLDIFDSQNLG